VSSPSAARIWNAPAAEARQKALDMLTLLGDERVKAAIAADKEAPQC